MSTGGAPGAVRRATNVDRLVLLVCAALAVLVVGLHVREYRQLSPIDELQHLDYLDKAPGGHVVARGERIGQTALREEACHGIDAPIAGLPSCLAPAPLDPEQFQERGFNTASVHPPTYYFLTGVAAKAAKSVLGVDSLHTTGRALGAAWLVLGVFVLWTVLVRRGAHPLTQLALLSMLVVAPAVVVSSSTISPDVTGVFAGALVLAALFAWEDERLGAWAPALAVGFALSLKFTHIGALGVVVLYVSVRLLQQRDLQALRAWRTDALVRRGATVLVACIGTAFALLAVWTVVQAAIAKLPQSQIPMADSLRGDGFPLADLIGQLDAVLSPLKNPYVAPPLRNAYVLAINHVVDLAALVAVASAAVFAPGRSRERAVAFASGAAMVALGPVTMLSSYLSTDTVTATPTRYGLPIVPAIVVAALPAMERTWVRRSVAAVAAVVVLVVVRRLLAS